MLKSDVILMNFWLSFLHHYFHFDSVEFMSCCECVFFFCKTFVCSVTFFYSFYWTDLFFQVIQGNWLISYTIFVIMLIYVVNQAEHTQKVNFVSYFSNACSRFLFHCYSHFRIKLTQKTSSFTHRKQVFLRWYTQYFILFIKPRRNFIVMCQFLKFVITLS